ncbi:MAG: ATP-binding protein [Ferrimonas sp.]
MGSRSLTLKLCAVIALVSVVMMLLVTYWGLESQYQHKHELMAQLLQSQQQQLVRATPKNKDQPLSLNHQGIDEFFSAHPQVHYGVFSLGGFKNAYRYQVADAAPCTPHWPALPFNFQSVCLHLDGSLAYEKHQLYYSISYQVDDLFSLNYERLLLLALFLLCAFGGLYFYAARLFIRPLDQILTKLPEMGSGNVGFSNAVTQRSELRQLAIALQVTDEQLEANRAKDEALNRRLRKALLARSEFMANASHEIRTPINAIIGFVDVMTADREAYPLELQDHLTHIASASYALLKIVDEVLDFSKLDSDKMRLEPLDFALIDSFSERVLSFSGQAQANGVQLFCEIDQRLPPYVKGDEGRLGQILSNLLSNAIKFAPNGNVAARLLLEQQSGRESRVRIEIEDNGIGIEPAALASIFDAYSQADTSVTRQYGGTGLGLAICKKLAELMDAELDVVSTLGKGSCFSLKLTVPLGTAPAPETKPYRRQEPPLRTIQITQSTDSNQTAAARQLVKEVSGRSTIVSGAISEENVADFSAHTKIAPASERYNSDAKVGASSLSGSLASPLATQDDAQLLADVAVMLVEDNKSNQAVMKVFLSKLGAPNALVCNNGLEAVQAAEKTAYQVILMDCQMPVMDGFNATRKIREGISKNALIIAITANVTAQDEQMCKEAGMDEFLTKPLTLGVLQQALTLLEPETA